METLYLTKDQRELLHEIATPGVPEHRVEALRDLALAPPSVGPEHGKSADPWHLNRQSMELLKGYEPSSVQAWAKETLRQDYPEGAALERAHKQTYVDIIDDRAGRALDGLREQREQERATSFAAPEHKEVGLLLLSNAGLKEKVSAFRELVRVPRAAGPEFGEVGEGLASWQRVAIRIVQDSGKEPFPSHTQLDRQLKNLGKALEQAPLGVPQQAENEIASERGLERLLKHAASLDLERSVKQMQELSRGSRGMGMGR